MTLVVAELEFRAVVGVGALQHPAELEFELVADQFARRDDQRRTVVDVGEFELDRGFVDDVALGITHSLGRGLITAGCHPVRVGEPEFEHVALLIETRRTRDEREERLVGRGDGVVVDVLGDGGVFVDRFAERERDLQPAGAARAAEDLRRHDVRVFEIKSLRRQLDEVALLLRVLYPGDAGHAVGQAVAEILFGVEHDAHPVPVVRVGHGRADADLRPIGGRDRVIADGRDALGLERLGENQRQLVFVGAARDLLEHRRDGVEEIERDRRGGGELVARLVRQVADRQLVLFSVDEFGRGDPDQRGILGVDRRPARHGGLLVAEAEGRVLRLGLDRSRIDRFGETHQHLRVGRRAEVQVLFEIDPFGRGAIKGHLDDHEAGDSEQDERGGGEGGLQPGGELAGLEFGDDGVATGGGHNHGAVGRHRLGRRSGGNGRMSHQRQGILRRFLAVDDNDQAFAVQQVGPRHLVGVGQAESPAEFLLVGGDVRGFGPRLVIKMGGRFLEGHAFAGPHPLHGLEGFCRDGLPLQGGAHHLAGGIERRAGEEPRQRLRGVERHLERLALA